jgi:putative Ca2+/H+ antiporter (TMEM165/GDT1 family)
MTKKQIISIISGIIFSLLGLLWFLQGSDLVHVKPILCFANCEPITGKSLTWQITGAIFFIVGALLIYKNIKKQKI